MSRSSAMSSSLDWETATGAAAASVCSAGWALGAAGL